MYYACDNILYLFHYHHFHSFVFYKVIYIEKSITCIKYIDINMLVVGGLRALCMICMVNPPIKPVDVFLYVKKQLKLFFDIPRFTIAYENMTVFSLKFIR